MVTSSLVFTKFVCFFLSFFVYLFVSLFQCPNTSCFQHSCDQTVGPRVTKFGMGMYLDNIWVDLGDQGHRSKVKVIRSQKPDFLALLYIF